MGGGLESRCVGRVCGADGAVRSKIPRVEHNTVHSYQHYSLFLSNKLRYT